MASDKDKLFEKIYFLWKGEGEKRNLSIDWYCDHYGAKVEEFRKWFQGINKSVSFLFEENAVLLHLKNKQNVINKRLDQEDQRRTLSKKQGFCKKVE